MANKNLSASDVVKAALELKKAMGTHIAAEERDSDAILRNANAFDGSTQKLNGAWERTQAAFKDVVRGLGSTTMTIAKGDTTFSALDESIKGTLSAVDRFAGVIPGASFALEGLSKILPLLTREAQNSLDTFQKFSDYGANAADGIEGMRERANHLLITYDKLNGILGENSASFAMYGNTVSDGVEVFEKIQTTLANTDDGLRNLGYSSESMAKASAAYVAIQSKATIGQRIRDDQLTKGTQEYLRELDAVARLTGKSKEELAKKDQEVLAETTFAARNLMLQKRGPEGQKQLEKELSANRAVTGVFGEEVGKGFRAALAGVPTQDYLKFVSTISGGRETVEKLKTGEINEEQLLDLFKKGVDEKFGNRSEAEIRGLAAAEAGGTTPFYNLAEITKILGFEEGSFGKAKEQSKKAEEGTEVTTGLSGEQKKIEQTRANLQDIVSDSLPLFTKGLSQATGGLEQLAGITKELTGQQQGWIERIKERGKSILGMSSSPMSKPMTNEEFLQARIPKTLGGEAAREKIAPTLATAAGSAGAQQALTGLTQAIGTFGQPMTEEQFANARISKIKGGERARAEIATEVGQETLPQTVSATTSAEPAIIPQPNTPDVDQSITTAVDEQRTRVNTTRYEEQQLTITQQILKELRSIGLDVADLYEWAVAFGNDIEFAFDVKEKIEAKTEAQARAQMSFGDRLQSSLSAATGGLIPKPSGGGGRGGAGGGARGEPVDLGPPGVGVQGLLEQISRGEGTSDAVAKKHGFASGYDVSLGYGAYGGGTSKPLSEMTVGEVKEYQRRMLKDPNNRFNSSAVGKYQIVGTTLRGLQNELNISDDEKFDAAMQDRLGQQLLNRRGLKQYMSGKISGSKFQDNLANEWASIATSTTGRSAYGQGTGTSSSQIQSAIAGLSQPEPALASAPTAATTPQVQPAGPQTVAQTQLVDFKSEAADAVAQQKKDFDSVFKPPGMPNAAMPGQGFPGVTSVSSTGFGEGSLVTPTTQNLVAPESAPAKLDTASFQPQKPDAAAASPAAPTQGSDNEVLAGLMSEQLNQLSSLNGLMKKQNATTEQILKSQK